MGNMGDLDLVKLLPTMHLSSNSPLCSLDYIK